MSLSKIYVGSITLLAPPYPMSGKCSTCCSFSHRPTQRKPKSSQITSKSHQPARAVRESALFVSGVNSKDHIQSSNGIRGCSSRLFPCDLHPANASDPSERLNAPAPLLWMERAARSQHNCLLLPIFFRAPTDLLFWSPVALIRLRRVLVGRWNF